MSSLFPMFIKLAEKRCLVVGAGKVGEPKIAGLIETGACIQVVAMAASRQVLEWADAGRIELEMRAFTASDLDDKFLAIVATASGSLNELIYREARRRKVLCNVVDFPAHCDFFYPAVVRRGELQIAISTAGRSPSLAQKLRQQLEWQFGEEYAAWVEQLGVTRQLILASTLEKERKLELLHSLASREAFEAELAKVPGVEHEKFKAKGESA